MFLSGSSVNAAKEKDTLRRNNRLSFDENWLPPEQIPFFSGDSSVTVEI
jgi:hypothetical protein